MKAITDIPAMKAQIKSEPTASNCETINQINRPVRCLGSVMSSVISHLLLGIDWCLFLLEQISLTKFWLTNIQSNFNVEEYVSTASFFWVASILFFSQGVTYSTLSGMMLKTFLARS